MQRQNLPLSDRPGGKPPVQNQSGRGDGNRYRQDLCYIKTVFEMNKAVRLDKFIVVVPASPFARAQVAGITAEHFTERLAKGPFSLSTTRNCTIWKVFFDAGYQCDGDQYPGVLTPRVKITGIIYDELDDFQSRKLSM